MALVRNGLQKLDWSPQLFVSPPGKGFVAAITGYYRRDVSDEAIGVCFSEGNAFTFWDEEMGVLWTPSMLLRYVKESTDFERADPAKWENGILLESRTLVTFPEVYGQWGLAFLRDDVRARLRDLSIYWSS